MAIAEIASRRGPEQASETMMAAARQASAGANVVGGGALPGHPTACATLKRRSHASQPVPGLRHLPDHGTYSLTSPYRSQGKLLMKAFRFQSPRDLVICPLPEPWPGPRARTREAGPLKALTRSARPPSAHLIWGLPAVGSSAHTLSPPPHHHALDSLSPPLLRKHHPYFAPIPSSSAVSGSWELLHAGCGR